MPKIGIVLLGCALLAGAAARASAQDATLRAELRLKETASGHGTVDPPDGNFILNLSARNAATDGLTSVGVALGDLDLTFPLTGGRFKGRIRDGGVDVRALVTARRGRVNVKLDGTVRDGSGSVFGVRAFNASADVSRWDGTIYGVEAATLSLDTAANTIPVGIAGRSDRRRR